MKNTLQWIALALCLLCLPMVAGAEEAQGQSLYFEDVGIEAAFPAGWTVITHDNAGRHLALLGEMAVEIALENLRADGIQAVAVSPGGDVYLRVIAVAEEGDVALYYDIERYTPAMRTAIKNDFLNRELWALTGYRYTEADWTNREGEGRILNLKYTVRSGEDITARGRQAYTIRDGLAITLDMQVEGRQIDKADERIFTAFVRGCTLPESVDFPLLPVGLTLTGVVPEETHKAELTVRGETTKGALVKAWVMPENGDDAIGVGQVKANNSATFKLDIVLPSEGEWRLFIEATMDGMASSGETAWVSYQAKRLPVTFTSYPQGDYYGEQVIISGKTVAGVSIQCMEGDSVNKRVTTGSDGTFSFKMDRTATGNRTIVLSMTKNGFDYRRFDITFNRQWEREDYVKYLAGQVQSLSYENLSEKADKYIGRLVRYSGEVLDISGVDDRVYVQLGIKQDKESGRWTQRVIAVADGVEVALAEGDKATIYFEVTGQFYTFSEMTLDGDEVTLDLPSVRLLTYAKD